MTPLNLIGWILSFALILTEIFVIYDAHLYEIPPQPWSRESHIWYESTSRQVWAIALGFVIFSCSMGKGGNKIRHLTLHFSILFEFINLLIKLFSKQTGFINDILSWSVWIPLARLSFSTYLMHVFCIEWYLNTYEGQIYFDTFSMVNNLYDY